MMITLIILGLIFFLTAILSVSKKVSIETAFPPQWRNILEEEIHYYQQLSSEDKIVFEKRVQTFLAEKKITGVDVSVDDRTRVMVAASAVIPAFAFEGYNYPTIKEVLLYSSTFNDSFLHPNQEMKQDHISGMVGEGPLSQVVMLSKTHLISDFEHRNQHHNVGIHEFTHLLDKTDGIVDGIPENLLEKKNRDPWLNEMHKEVQKIRAGSSDISPYALTNDAEFFAVASEYFFVSPVEFKKKHPELLAYLQKIFQQDLSSDTVKND